MAHLGERVRLARQAQRFTLRGLADITDIPFQRIYAFEQGTRRPNAIERRLLAAALHRPQQELFGEEECSPADLQKVG